MLTVLIIELAVVAIGISWAIVDSIMEIIREGK